MPDPIDRAFAFIVESPEGEDIGVMAIMTKGGPMVLSGTDMSRVPKLIPAACAVARKTRTKVRVVEFIAPQVIGRIDEHGDFHPHAGGGGQNQTGLNIRRVLEEK